MIVAVGRIGGLGGTARLLLFLTFLSANLAILNFLPIPALDGGHIMFLTAEAVTGKPVDERLQNTLTLIGVVCLLALMVLVFRNDIGRLLCRQGRRRRARGETVQRRAWRIRQGACKSQRPGSSGRRDVPRRVGPTGHPATPRPVS